MKKIVVALVASISGYSYSDLELSTTDIGEIDLKGNKSYCFENDLNYVLNSTQSNGETNSKKNLSANLLF